MSLPLLACIFLAAGAVITVCNAYASNQKIRKVELLELAHGKRYMPFDDPLQEANRRTAIWKHNEQLLEHATCFTIDSDAENMVLHPYMLCRTCSHARAIWFSHNYTECRSCLAINFKTNHEN